MIYPSVESRPLRAAQPIDIIVTSLLGNISLLRSAKLRVKVAQHIRTYGEMWRCVELVQRIRSDSSGCSLFDASRFWRILTVLYNTQNYWISGLCPSFGILNARQHKLKAAALTWVVQWLRLALFRVPNIVGISIPSPEDGNRCSFRNVVFSCI
jgi:hypothetical protein